MFANAPDRIQRDDVVVMQQETVDDLPHIQQPWPAFEQLVGLRGRKRYAMADGRTYTACTPLRDGDDPEQLGLALGTLPGGTYLRGRIVGEPPQLYEQIGPGMTQLAQSADVDDSRPLVEYYRRHTEIELWVPV